MFAIIFYYVKYKKIDNGLLFIFCIIILFGSFSILAPGNRVRYYAEIDRWYPGFSDLTLTHKALESLSWSLDRFVNIFRLEYKQFNLLMISISLMIFVICKDKKIISKISLLPLIYFLIKVLFNPSFGYLIFDDNLKHLSKINGVMSLILCIAIFMIMGTCLYNCFEDIESKLISVVLFLGAILSGFVVGFSPTIFESGARIFFCSFIYNYFLYVIFFNFR